jgi:radical SAM superfamily enzyme YgiQ (UPF0313 family)
MLEHSDILVVGEADEVWPRVVADAAAGRLQPLYRAAQPSSLEALPVPRYDFLNRGRIGLWRPVQATRGCPYACTFCSVTAFHHQRHRRRPIDQVLRDVRAAVRSGTRHVAFVDDNLSADWDYAARLWEALVPERVVWMSHASLHIAERPDLLRPAHRSGCRMLSFGLGSTSEESLDSVAKSRNQPERYAGAARVIREHGIEVSTEMMLGLDGDDASVFERTYRFLIDPRIAVPRVHIMTPVPGTPLCAQLEAEGRILSRRFDRCTGGDVMFRPRRMAAEALQAGYWKLYESLFTPRAILHRAGPNPARLGPHMRGVV